MIIGEIKRQERLFKQADFDKIKETSKIIRPDLVIFTSLDKVEPSTRVKGMINKLNDELTDEQIEAKWYPLKHLR